MRRQNTDIAWNGIMLHCYPFTLVHHGVMLRCYVTCLYQPFNNETDAATKEVRMRQAPVAVTDSCLA